MLAMTAENTNHGSAPPCPGPAPNPRRPTRYAVPAGAVDTHAHVIGLPPEYPFVEGRAYTPPAAPPAAYLGMLDGTGMTHGVLIQVSVHGTDNRLMLDTLRANRNRLKGIAVAPLGLLDKDYRAMKEAGVVGLRLNVLYGGGIGFERLADYGALCRELGWHLQFLLDARKLSILAPAISRLPVPFVVDHMGDFRRVGRQGAGLPDTSQPYARRRLGRSSPVPSASPARERRITRRFLLSRRHSSLLGLTAVFGVPTGRMSPTGSTCPTSATPRSHGRLGAG